MADDVVRDALRYIAEYSGESIRVDDVASALHMSRRSIERRFRKHLDRTVLEEIRRMHIQRARTLLSATGMPLLQVALSSGFQSSSDLSKTFARHVGMSPSEYRRSAGRQR